MCKKKASIFLIIFLFIKLDFSKVLMDIIFSQTVLEKTGILLICQYTYSDHLFLLSCIINILIINILIVTYL